MSTKRKNNSYSQQFRETAVQLVLEGSKSQRKVSEDLGVNVNTLQKWKQDYLDSKNPQKITEKEDQTEIKRLQKELYEAKLEVEILKKAVVYFSKDQV